MKLKFHFAVLFFLILLLIVSCSKEDDLNPNQKVFPVYDIDGNGYDTVHIGNQIWLKQNLRVTHYRNGDSLKNETNEWNFTNSDSGVFCYYKNLESNADTFGCLYNYFAVIDSRNICPEGWHIPGTAEWDSLFSYLISNNYGFNGGGEDIAKSLATQYSWISENTTSGTVGHDQGFNNLSGFSAPPAGKIVSGAFGDMGKTSNFWSSTIYYTYSAYYFSLNYKYSYISRNTSPFFAGFSIRCIKDN
ncbi:MAG: fibrobacter succinogenes major paralogous domain-containing protein [Bacteroidales bacterium]